MVNKIEHGFIKEGTESLGGTGLAWRSREGMEHECMVPEIFPDGVCLYLRSAGVHTSIFGGF